MKTLLVPTDFSNHGNNTIKYAGAFAQAIHSKLKLLHVYTPSLGMHNRISGLIAEETAAAKIKNKKTLDKLCDKYVKTPCATFVEIGNPVDEIISSSKNNKASLIIMGTHGASGLKRILFGSNTAETISKSDVPVLAIPQRYRFKKIKTIAYASDLRNSINELKHIISIARELKATIEIFYLNYIPDTSTDSRKIIEKKIKSLNYKKIKLIEQKADIEQTLLEQMNNYLKKSKPEMLVMFPEKKSWFDKIFTGSKTEELASHLKIPLLSIKKSIVKNN